MMEIENKKLIFVYDPSMARFMIRKLKGEYLYRIGKGNLGDVCISFERNKEVEKVMEEWDKSQFF